MGSSIRHITLDCRDAYRLAEFWSEALGFTEDPDNPNAPDDPEALIVDPQQRHPGLLFTPVPEPKATKNRLHLDLRPDQDRDREVERLLSIGATLVTDHRHDDGTGWVVLADPEGNEFCVERSAAERGLHAPQDSGRRPLPPVHAGGEREMLEAMLDWYRQGVVAKVDGVSQAVAVARPLPSASSIAGIVKHLAMVDESWFAVDFAGSSEAAWYAGIDWDADPDWEFESALDEQIEALLDQYRASCERSRAAAAGRDLDEVGAITTHRIGTFNLRFVYLHMIEETARHLGHIDIIRELLDGTTGD